MTGTPAVSERQNAIRLLACIDAAGTPAGDSWGTDVVAVLHGQSKLQALDFWMRNPDYLANELVDEFVVTGEKRYVQLARDILDSREPELRGLPMLRYHFGAFEPLDNALAILRAVDLVRVQRQGKPRQVREHFYLLTTRGRSAFNELAAAASEINWYKERAILVAALAGDASGSALKDRQYRQSEYASTELKSLIISVTERVRERLSKLDVA